MHPAVTQIIYVTSGSLLLIKKEPGGDRTSIEMAAGDAAVSRPFDLIQLVNNSSSTPAEVLYIVQPSFAFEPNADDARGEAPALYDDAILIADRWEDVPADAHSQLSSYEAGARRAEALRRLAATLGHGQSPVLEGFWPRFPSV